MNPTQTINLNQLRRISLLLSFLTSKPYRTKQDILNYFEENDKRFNERTFYRLKETLSRDFGIEIVFDYTYNGYYFDEENSSNSQNFLSLLEVITTAELFTNYFKNKKDALSFVEFENKGAMDSILNFKIILEAIQLQLPITFLHHNFYFQKESTYTLKPYFLKQYLNRWYVIGETEKGYRTFGIDRIENITLGNKKFKPKTDEAKEKFHNVIGLNYVDHKLEKIKLSFHASQKPYLISLPLHHSQKEIITNNHDSFDIELVIHPNFEFRQQILKYGSLVKIIEPQWLALEIKNDLYKAYKNY